MPTIARGLSYVDLQFRGRPRVIATAILEAPGGVTLVDPGPSTCLDTLRAGLDAQGIAIGDLRTVLLTHIHLDHAGATGTLVRENPELTVYVHERGARHMIDPSRLLASAGRLYGDEMDRLFGEFLPVPEANVRALAGGERVEVSDRTVEVAYLPGHASHHVGYLDRASGVAFVGDTAGIRTGPESFVGPPTPPPDIDLEAWQDSIAVMRDWAPATLFLTHFGPHEGVSAHLDALVEHLQASAAIARRCLDLPGDDDESESRRQAAFVEEMRAYVARYLDASEVDLHNDAAPLDQCWLGIARYWRKRLGA